MQREEAFPDYPPGAFASVARFGRRRFGATQRTGILELFDGRLTFTGRDGGVAWQAAVAEIVDLRVHDFSFDFEHSAHRWTVAFLNRGGAGDLRSAPRTPHGITGPHALPLFRLDDDTDAMQGLCARWVAELGG